MTTRRFLIFAPLALSLILVQSYFWVPTYNQQARGNPERLKEYINASIGDASLLNPVLSADSASSDIESMVFEGLIDRDQDLRFRGRLATSWKITEEAYFYVNSDASVPGVGRLGPGELVRYILDARKTVRPTTAELASSLANIAGADVIEPQDLSVTRKLPNASGKSGETVVLSGKTPARVKLSLNQVDPDLFTNMAQLLGAEYFSSFRPEDFLRADPAIAPEQLRVVAGDILPPTEHNPVIEFRLRSGVKFHDGYEFTARDVEFTYHAIMDPKNLSPRVADYEPVKAVQVIDPLIVRIVYKRLYSPALGTWGIGILPEHLLNAEVLKQEALSAGRDPKTFSLRDSKFNRHPVGCGPFVFERWQSDQYIILNRYQDYWEGPPNFHRYAYRVIPDLLTQEMEFYAGTLDSYDVQPYQVQRLKNDPRYQSFSGTSFGYTYIGYNMRRKPFDDVRVRRALGMAIDVDKIIKYVLYNQGERITGPFVKQTDYYDQNIKPLPYNPEGALKLLAEAGWRRNSQGWLEKDGKKLEFTLITNSGNDIRKAILAIAQDAWKQIGVDVRTDLLEWSVFIQQRVDKADFDALVLGWSMGIDPDLYQIWHSSQTGTNQLNFVSFKNAEADKLIIDIRQEYNHEKQVAYCHRLHEIIAEEQPYTFLYVGKWTAVLDKNIFIKEVDSSGKVIYKKITPTKTGNYRFYFNKWIKSAKMPQLAAN
jgi:ABC-type transport system substrate-binding protein